MRKSIVFVFFLFLFWAHAATSLHAQSLDFPVYGTGPIKVFLYTDYFCPPCRAMEPHVEPILKELLKKNAITLTLVDVPFSHLTPLYARHFLYALQGRNNWENAFRLRQMLMEAAALGQVNSEEKLTGFLKERGISYTRIDVKEVLNRYNSLMKEDKIDATPTCVIVSSEKKEKAIGGPDILKALKSIL